MTATRRPVPSSPAPMASVAVGVCAFVAYVALLCPVPADKDSGELTLVLATFGLAHPTGYPLYTLCGGVFVRLAHALGVPWAWSANAWSACGGAVAMGALHALAARLMAPRLGARAATWVALLPVGAFALNPAWTVETTLAEVNAWAVAWAMVAGLVAWHAARAFESGAARRAWFVWGVAAGAGLAHHATSVFFSAPLTVMLVASAARRGAVRALPWAVLGACVPLASLGYVAWRAWHPAAVQWPELAPAWESVRAHVSGAQYRTFLGHFAPSPGQRKLLGAFVYPWFVPAMLGAAWCTLRGDGVRRALGVCVLVQGAYCFAYGVPDPAPYFLAPTALGLALAVAALASLGGLERIGRALVLAGFAGVLAASIEGVVVARERNHSFAQFELLLRSMWDSLPRERAFVVWDDDMANRLRVYQILGGERRDLIVVQPRHLTHPGPRRRFTEMFGFDPLVDLGDLLEHPPASDADPRSQLMVQRIAAGINAHSALPVIEFLPQVPSVRMLRKP